MKHPLAFEPPTVVEIRTDWLHGPVHDWFLVPAWLHAELHRSGIEHHHRQRSDLHVSPDVDSVDTTVHTRGMTQTKSTREVPAAEVTAEMLATDSDFVVITPSGQRIGEMPSLAFGLGSWDGDTEGFAAWLRSQA